MSKKNRKRKFEGDDQLVLDWEQENLMSVEMKSEIESMWEIPQIFHFLCLAKEVLNITHLSMYEVERMLLIPRASKQLSHIMTCCLSSQISKTKVKKIPPMPYEFWTNVLAHKFKIWFKTYQAKHGDPVKVLESIGVEPEFWNIFPDSSLLDGKDFEELTFKQRVWLLKTVCDTIMHSRKSVQEEMANQPWENQFETFLGCDRDGSRYIYFPQFLDSDLRIYKHSIDNNVLSTVKPPKSEVEQKVQSINTNVRKKRNNRRRKCRWQNGLTPKSRKHVTKNQERHSANNRRNSIASSSNDVESFSNVDSFSNNNDIELNRLDVKKSGLSNLAKYSIDDDEKLENGDDCGTKTLDNSDQEIFKGLSSIEDDDNLSVVRGLLGSLTSRIEVSCKAVSSRNSSEPLKDDIVGKTINGTSGDQESIDESITNLSNSSKTDDEKLDAMIGNSESNNDGNNDNDMGSIASKSDDEKLSEQINNANGMDKETSLLDCVNSIIENSLNSAESEDDKHNTPFPENESTLIHSELEMESKIDRVIKKEPMDHESDDDIPLSELKIFKRENNRMQKEDESDDGNDSDFPIVEYNLRKLTKAQSKSWQQNFHKILTDLNVSKFQLVADSVESLYDLIVRFKKQHDQNRGKLGTVPACEIRLVKKLNELAVSLDENEAVLKDNMKKAKTKLQKEWSNFKEGIVEDQDVADESIPNSNWWVLGSQGCSLSSSGDATLQALSQSPLSSIGAQSGSDKQSTDPDSSQDTNFGEKNQGNDVLPDDQTQTNENRRSKKRSRKKEKSSSERRQSKQEETSEEKEDNDEDDEEDPQPRRVLRARGVSSYTEQFYSDEDSDENQLEEWPEFEANCTPPSAPARTPSANNSSKDGCVDDRSDEEDSDQDWILPSSRKRKNKRLSANRKLKTFHQKMHNVRVSTLAEMLSTAPLAPTGMIDILNSSEKTKESSMFKSNMFPKSLNKKTSSDRRTEKTPSTTIVPSANTICKIEPVDSVHSELDIKEEAPTYDASNSNKYENSYVLDTQKNNVVKTEPNEMSYYGPQNAPVQRAPSLVRAPGMIPGSVPPQSHSNYYLQGSPGYMMHPVPQNYGPPQMYHPQSRLPMMSTHQYMSHPRYMRYMMPPQMSMHQHPGYMNPSIPHPMSRPTMNQPAPGYNVPVRYPNNRFPPPPYPGLPVPNGAVIRNNAPVRTRPAGNVRPKVPPASPQKLQTPPQAPVRSKNNGSKKVTPSTSKSKTTSLIVLSDSDDEIEMIITEQNPSRSQKQKVPPSQPKEKPRQKPTVTSEITVTTSKGSIPPQIIQRMSQGGISITPVKTTPTKNPQSPTGTQLVVVVNETGSHYALALPNGSKLILTPEQVAQIRASNNGKLCL